MTVNCCWLLPNSTVFLHQINVEVSLINQYWVHRRGDTQMKNATKNLANSTKMRKSFATNYGNKFDPLDS